MTDLATNAEADSIRLHREKMEWLERAFAAEARLKEAEKVLAEIAVHPEKYDDGKRSYSVGWAFFNIQNLARAFINAGEK